MKNLFYFFVLTLLLISFKEGNSQNPTYELTATNFEFSNGCGYWNSIEFDIYMRNTGPTAFEYSSGQYFISFDPLIANGGTLTYEILESDLSALQKPRNPSVLTMQNPPATVLALAAGAFPVPGSGYIISADFPGTKIARMRLRTSSDEFVEDMQGDFAWRNPPMIGSTRIWAYVNGVNTDITTSNTHYIFGSQGPFICWGEVIPWCFCRYTHAISIKSIIEGFYNPTTNMLNRKDTVTIELRTLSDPNTIFSSQDLILDSINYSSYLIFTAYPVEPEVYIVVKHFNSIETWSKIAAHYHNDNLYYYDFTDEAAKAFGDNLKLVGDKFTIYSGDVNQDKVIDITDLSIIDNDAYNIAQGSFLPADLNADNVVDLADVQIADNNAFNLVTAMTPLN